MASQTIGANPNPDARYILNDSGTSTTNYTANLNVAGTFTLQAGGGTGTLSAAGTVNVQTAIGTAASSGTGVTEDVLFTYTLPASTLTGSKALIIVAAGTLKADSSTKTTKMYFGTTVFTVGTGTQSGISWRGQMEVVRTGASTQFCVNTSAYGGTITALSNVAGTDTDTGTIVIKVTGQLTGTASTNGVQANYFSVMLEN